MATGNWQLATGNWQLATDNWQLATGRVKAKVPFEPRFYAARWCFVRLFCGFLFLFLFGVGVVIVVNCQDATNPNIPHTGHPDTGP